MAYHEKDFQRDFNKWAKHVLKSNMACELKVTKGKSLPFDRLEEHQRHALLVAKHKALSYKISDDSIGQKPFDAFVMSEVPATVVILFNSDEQRKEFFMCDIDVFLSEEESSDRKSLTRDRASEICHRCELA